MIKKGTKLFSILKNRCPRCQDGDFFVSSNPLKLKGTLKINENCPKCGLKYMIEPSFFYGAMYVSYALTVAIAIGTFVICYWLNFNLVQTLISIVVILILLIPFLVRISRLIYINMFIGYNKNEEL